MGIKLQRELKFKNAKLQNLIDKLLEDGRPDWSLKPDPRFPPIRNIGQLEINKNKEGENNND